MNRFGSRCEDGSIDQAKNRYVKNFRYIRAIQKAIKKNPIYSKYSKIANDDAKKTLGVVSTCVRKYIKRLLNLSYIQRENLIMDRRCNIFKEIFDESVTQCQKKDEDLKQSNQPDKKYDKHNNSSKTKLQWSYVSKKKLKLDQYWFLRHEKLFHSKLHKFPLISPLRSKRTKSAKKQIESYKLDKLDSISAKGLKHPHRLKKHQRSVFEAIQKYAKNSGKSKISTESTSCTITKINV